MSLLLAIDPGASPSRPGCDAKGCTHTTTTSVRAYLGQRHPTTIRVCEAHRRGLEVIGDLENPVICLIPECGRTRAPSSRLCAEHDRIVATAKIRIPKAGVIGTETLLAVRQAVEAEEKRQAAIAAAPTVQPDPLRIQATPGDGVCIAVEWALDEVKAPRADSLSARIGALAAQRDQLAVHLTAVREALNVGPASDSDVRPETTPEELVRIVRARTVCMLDERDQRVALAVRVQELEAAQADPLAPAVKALVAWLNLQTGAALLEQMIRAVAKRTVPPEAAIRALRSEEEMARIILSTPEPFGVPF